jgi:UDP-galactopyranose mutase
MNKGQNTPAPVCVAGAGFSGAVIAWHLAEAGYRVEVHDTRDHIGGNCYTFRDAETGVMVHRYGPHIFHTDNAEVWEFVNRFTRFRPYTNRVKAAHAGEVYSLPVNLHTINQLYRTTLNPADAAALLKREAVALDRPPETFEEQALGMIGDRLYRAFFYGYTRKQWGCEPRELPASILQRLPVRFNYDDNYFAHAFQGMPEQGYTPIFEKLLDHPNITVQLNSSIDREQIRHFSHTFYSGPIDRYFDYELGELGYRTLDFEQETHDGDFQGCAVMNYCDSGIPFTRITEHKHFAPWEKHEKTVIFREYSRAATRSDTPYYPIRLVDDKTLLNNYVERANRETGITFVGRLGTYRYLDMDKTIEEALIVSRRFQELQRDNGDIPVFSTRHSDHPAIKRITHHETGFFNSENRCRPLFRRHLLHHQVRPRLGRTRPRCHGHWLSGQRAAAMDSLYRQADKPGATTR